tara:strand:+ start:507 stop:3272 length:2766 start_codon:yes stop_codon:yes gene_type:complete
MAEFYGNKPTSQLYLLLSKLNPSFSDGKLDTFRNGFIQINQFPDDPQFEYALPSSDWNQKRFLQLPTPFIPIPEPPEVSFSSLSLSSSISSSSSDGTTGTPTDLDSTTDATSPTSTEDEDDSTTGGTGTTSNSTDDGETGSTGDGGDCTGCNTPLQSGDLLFTAKRFSNAVFSNIRHSVTWKINVDFMLRPPSGQLEYPPSAGFGNNVPMPEGTKVYLEQRKFTGGIGGCSNRTDGSWLGGFDPTCQCNAQWDVTSRYMGQIGYVSGSDVGDGDGLGFMGEMRGTIQSKSVTAHYDLIPASCEFGIGTCPGTGIGEYKPCRWVPKDEYGTPVSSDIIDLDFGELRSYVSSAINSGTYETTLPFTNLYPSFPAQMFEYWQDLYLEARGITDPSDTNAPCPEQNCWSTVAQNAIPDHFANDWFSLPHVGGTGTPRYGPDGEASYFYYTQAESDAQTHAGWTTWGGVFNCIWNVHNTPMTDYCVDTNDPDCNFTGSGVPGWGWDYGDVFCKECYDGTTDSPCHDGVNNVCPDFSTAGGFWPPIYNDCGNNGVGCVEQSPCDGECIDCNGGGNNLASAYYIDTDPGFGVEVADNISVKLELEGYFQGQDTISRRFGPDSEYACVVEVDGTTITLPFDYLQVIPVSAPKLKWTRRCQELDNCPFTDEDQTIYFGGQSMLNVPIVTVATDCNTQINHVQEDCDPMAGAAFAGDYNGPLWQDIDTNNTLFGDVIAAQGHTGNLPRINGPIWPAVHFRWYQWDAPYEDNFGWLTRRKSPFFYCCEDDITKPHTGTDSPELRGFKRDCDDAVLALLPTDSSFYDPNHWYGPAPETFLHEQKLVDPECVSGLEAWEGTYVLPLEFYGLFETRYRYEVPIQGTDPIEYEIFFSDWKNSNSSGQGSVSSFICDLVVGYKVTSNYVTLDAGTPI